MEKCRSEEDLYVFEERLVPDKWNLFNTRFNGEKKKNYRNNGALWRYFIIELRRVTQLSFMKKAAMRIYISAPSSEPIKLSAAKRLLAISGPAGND